MTIRYIYDNIATRMQRNKNIVTQRTKLKKPARFSPHPHPGYSIKGRVWLEKDGELYLGWGRVVLLQRIEKFGSIAAAAKSMGLAYRNAWLWIDAMNRLAPSPLVVKSVGGTGGGKALLTDEAHQVIAKYRRLHSLLINLIQQLD